MTGRADRVGLSLREKKPSGPLVSSGPEMGLEPGQAAPYSERQAHLEFLVGRPRVGDKALAARLSGVHAYAPASLLSPTNGT